MLAYYRKEHTFRALKELREACRRVAPSAEFPIWSQIAESDSPEPSKPPKFSKSTQNCWTLTREGFVIGRAESLRSGNIIDNAISSASCWRVKLRQATKPSLEAKKRLGKKASPFDGFYRMRDKRTLERYLGAVFVVLFRLNSRKRGCCVLDREWGSESISRWERKRTTMLLVPQPEEQHFRESLITWLIVDSISRTASAPLTKEPWLFLFLSDPSHFNSPQSAAASRTLP